MNFLNLVALLVAVSATPEGMLLSERIARAIQDAFGPPPAAGAAGMVVSIPQPKDSTVKDSPSPDAFVYRVPILERMRRMVERRYNEAIDFDLLDDERFRVLRIP